MTQATSTQQQQFVIRTVTTDIRDLYINRLVYSGGYEVALKVSEQTRTIRLSVSDWELVSGSLRDGDPVNEDQADGILDMLASA